AAVGIAANRARGAGKRRRLAREKLLGSGRGVRMFERRQRLRMERARWRRIDQVLFLLFFLRGGRSGEREEENGNQAGSSAHQRLFFMRIFLLRMFLLMVLVLLF